MIEQQVFKASREAARFKLPQEEAKNSFGYYIDIPNDWESYNCPEKLIPFLGIHSTHIAHFPEITADLGPLTEAEHNWLRRYVEIYENIAKLLSTTGAKVDFRYDIAETLFDWRTVQNFIASPSRILDFGAGCGRQAVSAFLRNSESIYTAIDSTLAAYTLQNLTFSYMDTLDPNHKTYDFLDFEVAGKPFPKLSDASTGSYFHIPTWLAEEHIPERYYDVIFGCHVHNELSGPDFMRLMRIVEKGLADDGVFYLRSEVTVIDPYDFFDAVDLHAIDPIELLHEKDIVPVYSVLECAYLTTVFARKNSRHYKEAIKNKSSENSFTEVRKAMDLSTAVGRDFVKQQLKGIRKLGKKVATIGNVTDFIKLHLKTADIVGLLKFTLRKFFDKHVYQEKEFLGTEDNGKLEEFRKLDPDIVIICSHRHGEIEQKLKELFPNKEFSLRRQYWFPIIFLYEKSIVKTDKVFNNPIMGTMDLEGRL